MIDFSAHKKFWLLLIIPIIIFILVLLFLNNGKPINSNGVPNSQHLVGEAVDIKPYGSTTFNKLLEEIHFFSDNVSPFDQLIIYPTFIHISFCSRNRQQVIDNR